MYVHTYVPIMTTKLCLFYPEFDSFPYMFSSLSPIHALLINFVPFSNSLSLALSSAALMCRKRSGNASTSTLHGFIQDLSQFEQVYWADGAYLTLSYNTLLSVWLFMTCACCLARVWHHISKIARTSAFLVVSFHFLCVFVFCLHSPFACVCLSLMVIQSLSGYPLELSVCVWGWLELPSWQPGCQPQLRLLQARSRRGG